ncbi:MAG: phosphatidylserine decarboxylase family protein [Pirellulaceae bacterium]|jgi:phosphatidylserine decarboxylase|nr:phosphatidylserine decarboxylase family protein [Pirellulaceae bacterium]
MTQQPCEPTGDPDPAIGKRIAVEPLDPAIGSIQPGGGACMRIELAWGRLRRAYLRMFRRGYLRRMEALRRGEVNRCPHAVLDPRDAKFFRNQGGFYWTRADDPFAWRDRLPVVRVGLAELLLLSGTCFALAFIAALVYWPVSFVPAALGLFVISFFRNPRRVIPDAPGQVVAPADGKVVAIEDLPHDDYVGGRAVLIGIFLSVFNVHVNRSPVAARVIGLTYRRGKFLNALRAASAQENEQLAVRLEETAFPHRRLIVRQIAGAIARRIVCWVAPGEELDRGEQFGMIKLGSRTELVLPWEPGLQVRVSVGDQVRAGSSVMAQYGSDADERAP